MNIEDLSMESWRERTDVNTGDTLKHNEEEEKEPFDHWRDANGFLEAISRIEKLNWVIVGFMLQQYSRSTKSG